MIVVVKPNENLKWERKLYGAGDTLSLPDGVIDQEKKHVES